jgi:hypothetical protein
MWGRRNNYAGDQITPLSGCFVGVPDFNDQAHLKRGERSLKLFDSRGVINVEQAVHLLLVNTHAPRQFRLSDAAGAKRFI